MRLKVRDLKYGAYKVTARVVFATASGTKAKTLQAPVQPLPPGDRAPEVHRLIKDGSGQYRGRAFGRGLFVSGAARSPRDRSPDRAWRGRRELCACPAQRVRYAGASLRRDRPVRDAKGGNRPGDDRQGAVDAVATEGADQAQARNREAGHHRLTDVRTGGPNGYGRALGEGGAAVAVPGGARY